VLQECEQEAGRSLDGTIPFIRRIIPAVGTGWANSVSSQDNSSEDGSTAIEIAADSELSGKSKVAGAVKRKSLFSKFTGRKG
jgi:hypothetical protein